MKYQIVYVSQSGNTEYLAQAIEGCLPADETQLVNLNTQTPSLDAEVYCVGFGVRHNACPLNVLDFLEQLTDKTVIAFATCGMKASEAYQESIERGIEPFLPEDCDYRGLYLCQGSISSEGAAALRHRFEKTGDAEMIKKFDAYCQTTSGYPTREEAVDACRFVTEALNL